MYKSDHDIKNDFIKILEGYLTDNDETSLNAAYELGRGAADNDVGELKLLNIYQEALRDLNEKHPIFNDSEILFQVLALLTESLAPYEMRQRGFKDLIGSLNVQNKKLQSEVNQRKAYEKELKQSKEHFQNLIENALDIVTVLDHNGTIQYESPSLKRILGFEPDELIGQNVFNLIHDEDIDLIRQTFSSLIKVPNGTDHAEFRFRHKNGTWRYLESIAKNVVDSREGSCVIVNSRDVTDSVTALKNLKKSERQLAKAQQIGRFGSWEWDIVNDEIQWSAQMCSIYGVNQDETPQSFDEFLQFLHRDDREKSRRIIEDAYNRKSVFGFEHRIIRPDGSSRVLFGRGEVITNNLGEPVKMIGTGQDITEIKEAERKLKLYSNQLRRLSAHQEKVRENERIRIARELHDELGQMLSVLKMDVFLAVENSRDKFDGEAGNEFLNEFKIIIERIDTIIRSVQRITSELRPEVLDDLGLEEAIKWQVQEFEKRTNISTEYVNNGGNLDKMEDELSTAIFRILQETMTNVLRHSNASKVTVSLDIDNQYFVLKTRDNGVGITREKIEDPNSFGITGMQERAHLFGGNITFSGKKGQGTEVTLKIPLEGMWNEFKDLNS